MCPNLLRHQTHQTTLTLLNSNKEHTDNMTEVKMGETIVRKPDREQTCSHQQGWERLGKVSNGKSVQGRILERQTWGSINLPDGVGKSWGLNTREADARDWTDDWERQWQVSQIILMELRQIVTVVLKKPWEIHTSDIIYVKTLPEPDLSLMMLRTQSPHF